MAVNAEEKPGPRTQAGSLFNEDGTTPATPRPTTSQTSTSTGRQPTAFAYWPKDYSEITVNTSNLAGVADASWFGSDTWNKQYAAKDAVLEWDALDGNFQQDVTRLAKARGGRSGSALWEKAVAISEKSVREGKPRTPFDVLNDMAGNAGADPAGGSRGRGGSGGSGGSGGPSTSVSTTLTNEFDARTLVDNALNTYLGRNASEKERERFWKMLNKQESANPRVTSGASGVGVSQSVSSGGFSREQFAEDFAKSRKNYAEVQASTTLMGWMNSALAADTRMI